MRWTAHFALVTLIFFVALEAGAVTITDWTLNDCDDQGCEGAKISLKVEDLGGGTYRITQGLNLTMYDSGSEIPQTTVEAVGVKAVRGVTSITSLDSPGGAWNVFPVDTNVSGKGCGGNGNDKLCAQAANLGGVAFSDLATDADGWSYWVWIVEGTSVLDAEDQHYGLNYGPATGRLISAAIPEPSAALVFAVGAFVMGGSTVRRRG